MWYKTPTQNVQHKEYNMNLKKIFYTVICRSIIQNDYGKNIERLL